MAHKHQVYDTDLHFTIDKITRRISSTSGKVILMQNDHNSERFTFELDRYVEGHDMMLCDRVEVHYINIDSANKRNKTEDVYEVLDLQLSPVDENVVILSWLISQNATMYAGSLSFLIRFACTADDEERTIEYQWFTDIYALISIAKGIYNADVLTDEGDPDILAQWKQQIMDLAQPYVDSSANSAAAAAMSEMNARNSELNAATSEANAKESEQYAAVSETNAKISETNAAKSETNAAKSEANAKASEQYAAEYADKADNLNAETLETLQQVSESVAEYDARIGNTSFTVNLETGELEYESPDYIFYVNEETGNLEWETLHEHSVSADNIIHTVRNEKSDAVVLEAAGTYFVVEDSSDDPLRGLKLFGRTEQFTTTGAQLFDVNAMTLNTCRSMDVTEDGYEIVVTGKVDAAYAHTVAYLDVDLIKGKTIWLQADDIAINVASNGCAQLIVRKADGTIDYCSINSTTTKKSYTVGEDVTSVELSIYPNNGKTDLTEASVITIHGLRVCFAEDTPYEPYTGTVASPNPNYPQELKNAGGEKGILVKVLNSNLADINKITAISQEKITISGDTVTIAPTTYMYGIKVPVDFDFIVGETYTASCNFNGPHGSQHGWRIRYKDGAYGTVSNSFTYTFTVEKEIEWINLYVGFNISTAKENVISNIQINMHDSALDYKRYLGQSLTVDALPGIPVTSGGNYTDANGQQWISDEVDFERGVYVERCYKRIYKANEFEIQESGAFNVYVYDESEETIIDGNGLMLCNMATYPLNENNTCRSVYAGCRFRFDQVTTLEELEALIPDGIECLFIRREPLERSLSKEELETFKSLHTNYPITTVFNDSDVYMELKYNADTKNYIAAEHVKMEAAFNAKIAEVMALISAQT